MRRDRFYIGVAIFMAIVVATFVGLYFLGEHQYSAAVKELRAKSARIEKHTPNPHVEADDLPQSKPSDLSVPETDTTTKTQAESQIAYEALGENLESMYKETKLWKELVWGKKWKEWTPEELALVAKYLEGKKELFKEIRRLANMDGPLYDIYFEKAYWNDIKAQSPTLRNFPYGKLYRDFARLLDLEAFVAAAQGDYSTAIDNYITIINLANKAKNDSATIFQSIKDISVGLFYPTVSKTIQGEYLSLDILRRFVAAIYDTGKQDALTTAMATIGDYNLDIFDGVRYRNMNSTWYKPEGTETYLMYFYGNTLARPFLNMDEDAYANIMNRMSDVMALPYYEVKPLIDQIKEDVAELPLTRVLSRRMLPDINYIADGQARHEAILGLTQVGLTIEYYHGQQGIYPESLEEIAPILNGPMPLDPYTGQPFVYQPHHDNFDLYSARGSVIGSGPRRPTHFYNTQGNIVWRYTGE